MISLYNTISENSGWLEERLDHYISNNDILKNIGFGEDKQKITIYRLSDYICKLYGRRSSASEDYMQNENFSPAEFIKVFSILELDIDRTNIPRLVKLIKKVYMELVYHSNLPYEDERELLSFMSNFFDSFEINVYDNLYCIFNIKEIGEFTPDEFKRISLIFSETASLGILMSSDKKIIYINKYIESLLGYNIFDLEKINFWNIIDQSCHTMFMKKVETWKSGEINPEKYTLKVISKFNAEKWIDISEKMVIINNRKVMLMSIADITDYKKAQDVIIKNSESLRTLIDAMSDLVCFKDADGGWTEVNETVIDLLDLHEIDYKGMTNMQLSKTNNGCYREFYKLFNETDEKAWESGHAIYLEEIVEKPDGSKQIFDVTKVPLYYSDGNRKSIVALGKDVTQERQSKKRLMESEDRYKKLFNLSPDAIIILKKDRILLANQEAIKLLGEEGLEGVKGRSIYEFLEIDTKILLEYGNYIDVLAAKGPTTIIEEKWTRKCDEKQLDIDITCSLFPYEDISAVLLIARDVSERKRAETLKLQMIEKEKQLLEAIQYDNLRNEFFANISHELRTPLNVILVSLQLFEIMARNGKVDYNDEKFIKYTTVMKQNCYRLVKIVNNLIDITKIDSGYLPVHMNNGNIVEIVENIVMSIVEFAQNKDIAIQFDTDFEEKVIGFDPDKIDRIMLNLLSNAIKFTPSGGKIKIRIYCENGKVLISVSDNGIGIPDDKLNKIFERFVQVDRSLSRMNEGSGIGLSITKSLIEMQGGSITARSKLNEGSEFVIELADRLVDVDEEDPMKYYSEQNNMERINVEFSDIYF